MVSLCVVDRLTAQITSVLFCLDMLSPMVQRNHWTQSLRKFVYYVDVFVLTRCSCTDNPTHCPRFVVSFVNCCFSDIAGFEIQFQL